MTFHLHLRPDAAWAPVGASRARGHAFTPEGHRLCSADLAARLAASPPEVVLDRLSRLNGFFAWVEVRDGQLWAAVDHARSMPLFYGLRGAEVYVSDDADWVRASLDVVVYDPLARAEFTRLGFVSGTDTLYPGVRQLQAGEALRITPDASGRPVFALHRYRSGVPTARLERLEALFEAAFGRLIDQAAGRPLAVSLSGGVHARLTLLMLKRLGYDAVTTFTYGAVRGPEMALARQIAEDFKLPWRGMPLDASAWRRWFHATARHDYYAMADGLSSLPRLAPWVGVSELMASRALPPGCMVIAGFGAERLKCDPWGLPGMTVDRVPAEVLRTRSIGGDRRDRHAPVMPHLAARVERVLSRLGPFSDGAQALAAWDWHERQAKLLLNTVRAYEFWGLDWWLPFADRAVVDLAPAPALYTLQVRDLYRQTLGRHAADRLPWPGWPGPGASWGALLQALAERRPLREATLAVLGAALYRKHQADQTPMEAFLALDRVGELTLEPT